MAILQGNLHGSRGSARISDRWFLHDTPTGGDTGAGEEPSLRIGSNHCGKQGLSVRVELIICKKLLFLHRCGTKQPARFQADIRFAVRICHGRVFLTGTTGGGCRQWNDDGRKATMPDYVWHRNEVLKPDVKNFFSNNCRIIKIYCIFAASLRIFLENPQWRCGNSVRYVP